ncbi:MAG TPA: histidinol-phosphatase [Mycobacteriales bacterium]|nr:histidinol-phosphatase [Mycobacteriales bacterium]
MTGWDADLRLALDLADAADEITVARFGSRDLVVERKPDLTPVTDADRAVEQQLRDRLSRERPDDAVIGEEYGEGGSAPRRWIIDPIDGTKNFVRGVPIWATLIALQADDHVVVGAVSAPALHRRWWAASGAGAWVQVGQRDPTRCRASAVTSLDDASLSYASIGGWREAGRFDGFMALLGRVWRTRAYGDFWSHMLVAEGAVDVACEPEVSLWDLAALQVIVEESGGRFTDLTGVARPDGGSAVSSNGLLHDDVLAVLRP